MERRRTANAVPASTAGRSGDPRTIFCRPGGTPMRAYAIRRVIFIIPVLLAASIITFLALRLVPGDPALTFLGQQARPEDIERWHKDHGVDDPLVTQYLRWLGGMLHG